MPRLPGSDIPPRWVSIDPGDRYVGLAEWEGTECVITRELTPRELWDRLEEYSGWPHTGIRRIETIVCERWMLYPWNEESFAYNEFLTSQLIGVVKYIAERSGVVYVGQTAKEGKRTYSKVPWKDWTAKDWQRVLGGPIGRGHTRDAYAHGVEFKWNRGWRP